MAQEKAKEFEIELADLIDKHILLGHPVASMTFILDIVRVAIVYEFMYNAIENQGAEASPERRRGMIEALKTIRKEPNYDGENPLA